jgi:DNA-binding IclR family transcriptional regulator
VDLCRQTGETISLTILDGCDSLYVDEIPSRHPVRAHTYIGSRAPAHAVATGKAMICHHPGALQQLLAGELRRCTEHTIVDPVELERELKAVREHGYALNRGEWRPGVCAAAAAVRNHTALVAALGVSGPDSRLTRERLHQLGPLVRDAAARLSRDLGFVGAPGAAAS